MLPYECCTMQSSRNLNINHRAGLWLISSNAEMTVSRELGINPTSFGSMFWQNQFKTTIPLPHWDNSLHGRTAIITGPNSGLGFESAKQMLQAGLSKLVMGVRSVAKGEAAATQLRTVNSRAEILVWILDMEDYDSVQGVAGRCSSDLQRIDFVILNAGLGAKDFKLSKTGHEMSIQVNFLSTVLLCILLLPISQARRPIDRIPHMTLVSSATTRNVKFVNRDQRPLLPSFDDTKATPWNTPDRYAVSKLLVQLVVERIAEQYVDAKDIVINLVEPGWIRGTGLNRDLNPPLRQILGGILRVVGRPVDQGAATYLDAVASQDERSHGSYIMNCRPAP